MQAVSEASHIDKRLARDKQRKRAVLAFRGTSDILDAVTDVQLVQTPLEQGYGDQRSDDPRKVHSGFFRSARAVNRRLKELLVAACGGAPAEWDLLVTGHSLGGAIATLMATEHAESTKMMRNSSSVWVRIVSIT